MGDGRSSRIGKSEEELYVEMVVIIFSRSRGLRRDALNGSLQAPML